MRWVVPFALTFAVPVTFSVSVPVAISVSAAETGNSVAIGAFDARTILGELLLDFVEFFVVLLTDFAVLCF